MKYKIKRIVAILLLCIGICGIMPVTAYAGGGAINGDVKDIKDLQGKLVYINRSEL